MNFDKILIERNAIDALPEQTLDFFRETEDAFWNLFFYTYAFTHTPQETVDAIDDSLQACEWTGHGLMESDYDYQQASEDVLQAYHNFSRHMDRHLPFLKRQPLDIVLVDVTVWPQDSNTVGVRLSFTDQEGNDIDLSSPLLQRAVM